MRSAKQADQKRTTTKQAEGRVQRRLNSPHHRATAKLVPRPTSSHILQPLSACPLMPPQQAPYDRVLIYDEDHDASAMRDQNVATSCCSSHDKPDEPTCSINRGSCGVFAISGRLRLKLGNGVQRLLSALLLAPLITYFLWRSPAFATTTVCAVVVSIASYEYAWLAHRIHMRFVYAVEKYEATATSCEEDPRASSNSSSSHGSDRSQAATPPHSNTPTRPSSNDNSADTSDTLNSTEEPIQEELVAFTKKKCAVSSLASTWRIFCGSEWLAALLLSTGGAIASSAVFQAIASTHFFDGLDFEGFQLYYFLISSFSAWMCACFTPNWKYATLLLVEKEVFMALTIYSMKCPINNMRCELAVHPSMFMLAGFSCITVLRLLTAKSSLQLLLHVLLDVSGFIYIIGSLFFIVSFVDLDREATYRKLVIALLYVVWAADSGAYFVGQLMEMARYKHSHPLASHLSARKDYEGTCIAIGFGVAAMFVSSHLLEIHGTFLEKFFFAAVAVIVGRVGDLFESLLKRAALVKDSGTIIPGHGGILDRIDALMFAAIVFSRYFGAIIVPNGSS